MWILLYVSMLSFWKKSGDAIPIIEKKASITALQFKNHTQELDFLKIRYYANLILNRHLKKN